MKDRNMREIELFAPFKGKLKKKICIGVVSHRTLQVERPEEVAGTIRQALKHIAPEQLIVSSDCGFGRQGCNRDIAFFKSASIAQGTNIVRRELGLPETRVRAATRRSKPTSCPRRQTDRLAQVPIRRPNSRLPPPDWSSAGSFKPSDSVFGCHRSFGFRRSGFSAAGSRDNSFTSLLPAPDNFGWLPSQIGRMIMP